jgi:hypothetical protein
MAMRILFTVAALFIATTAFAQEPPEKLDPPQKSVVVDPANPSGNIVQPQGSTGPIHTQSGGAPAESPQGQSPPGMQPAPDGSDKSVRTGPGGVPEGSPKN